MAKSPKYLKPAERHVLSVSVLGNERIGPNFLRLTIGGEAMNEFVPMGFDQWFRVFLPNGDTMRAPTRSDRLWMAEWLLTPKSKRPIGRNLTVRSHRAAGDGRFGETAELDIDMFLHDSDATSAMAAWAIAAAPGDEFAILDEGRMHNPSPDTTWQLLAGDDTAMPAILRIIESHGEAMRGRALIELGDRADAQEIDVPDGFELTWLDRSPSGPGDALLDALRSTTLPEQSCYVYVGGPARIVGPARKFLHRERGLPAEATTCSAYWR